MLKHEKSFALVVPDYTPCNDRIRGRYSFPQKTYGDRVWERLRTFGDGDLYGEELFDLARAFLVPFPDGTLKVDIRDTDGKGSGSIRGKHVTIVHSPYLTDDRHTMIGAKLGDAAHRADAESVSLVEPYNGNYRQDRRSGRESLNAHVVAQVYMANHIGIVTTFDAHFKQLEGFFEDFDDIPLGGWIAIYTGQRKKPDGSPKYDLDGYAVVSPDFGSAERAEKIANLNGLKLVQLQKERDPATGKTRIVSVLGDVKDKNILIVDDVISSGDTVLDTARACRERGAKECIAMATHLELSDGAVDRLLGEGIKIIGTDTFYHDFTSEQLKHVDVMDTSGITASIIYLRATKKSIGRFLDWNNPANRELIKLSPLYSD